MRKYQWRQSIFVQHDFDGEEVRGKVTFKTENDHWLGTSTPVCLPVSIHSSFHEGPQGILKFKAFTSVIKDHTQGRKRVLFAEKAHFHVLQLEYPDRALEICRNERDHLMARYQPYLEGYEVTTWDEFISEDPSSYLAIKERILSLYATDPHFQQLILTDVESTYTLTRQQKIPDKPLFLEKSVQDIIEHITFVLVYAKQGFRFDFYPGRGFSSCHYILRLFENIYPLEQIYVSLRLDLKNNPEGKLDGISLVSSEVKV